MDGRGVESYGAAGDGPVYGAVFVAGAVYAVDWGVGRVVGDCGGCGVEVYDDLGGDVLAEGGSDDDVEVRDVDGGFVDDILDCKDGFEGWGGPEDC